MEAFNFCEQVESHEDRLWGNPAYASGSRITTAFAKYHWCAAIRGLEGGGLVEGLPVGTFFCRTKESRLSSVPTELGISDWREKKASGRPRLYSPWCIRREKTMSVLFSMQTCCKPRWYEERAADANARLSTQLQYVLMTPRFAHYLKVIMRDKYWKFYDTEGIVSDLSEPLD